MSENEQTETPANLAPLYMKMAAVMGHLERLPKRGVNKHFGYPYVTDSDVLDAVRKAMAEERVAFFVSMDATATTPKGSSVLLSLTFADGDTGAAKTIRWEGEAHDSQDKGINKAVTAGVKYCLLKTFLMSTGDDSDPDAGGGEGGEGQNPAQQSTGSTAYKLRFGKHKGKTIAEIGGDPATAGYLKWALENLDDDERNKELFAAIRAYLGMASSGASGSAPAQPYEQPTGDPFLNGEVERKGWPSGVVTAIIDAHLAGNTPNTIGMLNLSKVLTPSDELEFILTWANHYRSARADKEPKDAAAWADEQMPQAEPA